MKIVEAYPWRGGEEWTLRQAIAVTLDGRGDGAVESVAADLEQVKRMLRALIEALAENGKLTDRNIANILDDRFTVTF